MEREGRYVTLDTKRKARIEYRNGGQSYRTMAKKYGVYWTAVEQWVNDPYIDDACDILGARASRMAKVGPALRKKIEHRRGRPQDEQAGNAMLEATLTRNFPNKSSSIDRLLKQTSCIRGDCEGYDCWEHCQCGSGDHTNGPLCDQKRQTRVGCCYTCQRGHCKKAPCIHEGCNEVGCSTHCQCMSGNHDNGPLCGREPRGRSDRCSECYIKQCKSVDHDDEGKCRSKRHRSPLARVGVSKIHATIVASLTPEGCAPTAETPSALNTPEHTNEEEDADLESGPSLNDPSVGHDVPAPLVEEVIIATASAPSVRPRQPKDTAPRNIIKTRSGKKVGAPSAPPTPSKPRFELDGVNIDNSLSGPDGKLSWSRADIGSGYNSGVRSVLHFVQLTTAFGSVIKHVRSNGFHLSNISEEDGSAPTLDNGGFVGFVDATVRNGWRCMAREKGRCNTCISVIQETRDNASHADTVPGLETENGIPACLRECFTTLCDLPELSGVLGEHASERLAMVQFLFFTGNRTSATDRVLYSSRSIKFHVDRGCWPQGGVVSLFLFLTPGSDAIRIVAYQYNRRVVNRDGDEPCFVHAEGGAYSMGPMLFGKDETPYYHGVDMTLKKGEQAVVLLYRLATVDREGQHRRRR